MRRRPVAIDLFAGAGGMSLGFEQAGFDIVSAIEIDPVHSAVHAFNFPHCDVIAKSIEGLCGEDIRHSTRLGKLPVDCVFGGAPCQGFSLIGHRVLDDPRNQLVRDFVRIVAELDARSFVFENVKGLTVGKHQQFLSELISAFDEHGYDVVTPWRVLNAAHFGVPQFRERLFLMGVRKGEQLPLYPHAITSPADGRKPLKNLPSSPTVQEAIGDLPNLDDFEALAVTDHVRTTRFGRPSHYAAELRCMTSDAWHYSYPRIWRPDILTSSARTSHTKISQRRFSETAQGDVEPISRLFRLPAKGISNTLRAGTDGARGAFTSPRPIHFNHARCVSVREMARLHGFPDWFRFNVTKWHGARQIGNAVPPPLARAVASEVIAALGYTPSKPDEILELGDPTWLQFDLSAAARYFDVTPPVQRRDRKSGATKRKQADIERERLTRVQVASNG